MTHNPEIGFLFLGGEHQMLYLAPVAAELAKRGGVTVRAFAGEDESAALRILLGRLGSNLEIETLAAPRWSAGLTRLKGSWSAQKIPRLIAARRKLAALTMLVAAERTSTIIQRFPGAKAKLVHIPHGAGDRAKGFESRLRLFDHIIVAGDKDRDRMIAAGVVAPENCSVSGGIKVSAINLRLGAVDKPKLFENERPTILYNPHFARGLSSWPRFGEALIGAIASHDRYNLIVAPHVKMIERLSIGQRQAILNLARPDRVIIDLGSGRSCDMTYTNAADIYVGDVSSQVYEFISRPRPCVFLDAVDKDWSADPSFACWKFGDVVTHPSAAYEAVTCAAARFAEYRQVQIDAADAALGDPKADAVSMAADILVSLVYRHSGRSKPVPRHRQRGRKLETVE